MKTKNALNMVKFGPIIFLHDDGRIVEFDFKGRFNSVMNKLSQKKLDKKQMIIVRVKKAYVDDEIPTWGVACNENRKYSYDYLLRLQKRQNK